VADIGYAVRPLPFFDGRATSHPLASLLQSIRLTGDLGRFRRGTMSTRRCGTVRRRSRPCMNGSAMTRGGTPMRWTASTTSCETHRMSCWRFCSRTDEFVAAAGGAPRTRHRRGARPCPGTRTLVTLLAVLGGSAALALSGRAPLVIIASAIVYGATLMGSPPRSRLLSGSARLPPTGPPRSLPSPHCSPPVRPRARGSQAHSPTAHPPTRHWCGPPSCVPSRRW
jgi:hypothetical protein